MCTLKTIGHWQTKTKIIGKISHVHGMEELILLKYLYHQKWYTDSFNTFPFKIPMTFFTEIKSLKICMEPQKTIDKQAWGEKNKVRGMELPDFRYSNQNSMVLAQRWINSKARKKPKHYGQQNFYKRMKNT